MNVRRIGKWIVLLGVIFMTVPTLSSCGKKSRVEPPAGEKSDHPRKYPTY